MTPPDRPVPGDTEHARRAAVYLGGSALAVKTALRSQAWCRSSMTSPLAHERSRADGEVCATKS